MLRGTVGDMTIAVCPGSFDPVTYGHIHVIVKAARLFDEVHVAVVHNPDKHTLFTLDERVELLRESLAIQLSETSNVVVDKVGGGLLVDYCRWVGASAIVKGLRTSSDVDYELPMAYVNSDLGDVETVFLLPPAGLAHVSSSLVRQVASLGGDASPYVPEPVARRLSARFG